VDHAAVLIEQSRLLGELYRKADPATRVPTCPDWTLRQLVTHVGRGTRWAATIVRERADAYVDTRTVADGKPPPDLDGTVAWLEDSARSLLDAVAETGADTPVWTFTGPRPAAWWVRRRLHEATVHRADAALAFGAHYDLSAEVAADGISEWLGLLEARPASSGPVPLDIGQTMHLHATDEGLGAAGEWLVHGDAVALSWEQGHAKGQVAVRGRAVDLLLALMRRIPADDPGLEILGEHDLWHTWLERTGF
jgi:uncharacterized protein (TIGR03083 family)